MRLIGFVGSSGSGKTTLITALLPKLRAHGLRVSTVKHAHHGFDVDRPGKDSFQHRVAGAEEVMIASGGRWALLREERTDETLSLAALLARMTPVDLVLVEGFRHEAIPKIEVWRRETGKPPYWPDDKSIAAIATDDDIATDRIRLKLGDTTHIMAFILSRVMAEAA
ncbi:MAG TPA: molybdopterin-guanine dinucleotide biosynthesis protein B [Parvibaculum sp.]|jgi:molybdopterin-guanine dinucleotide biosynthesis protein B